MQTKSETAQFAESLSQTYLKSQMQEIMRVNRTAPLTTLSTAPNPQQLGTLANPGNGLYGSAPNVAAPPPVAVPISNSGNVKIAAISPVAKVAPIAGGVAPIAPVASVRPVATPKKSAAFTANTPPNQPTAPAPVSGVKTVATPARVAAPVGLQNVPINASPSAPSSPAYSLPSLTANVPSHNAGGGFQPVQYAPHPNQTPSEIQVSE